METVWRGILLETRRVPLLNSISKDRWRKIGTNKRAGILAPLFSIYSENSVGIGDFGDLKLLVDWASQTGNTIIQLLPMNEVGPLFCPYDALSSFALEPMYLSLSDLASSKKKNIQAEVEKLKNTFTLSGKTYVDYRIKQEKLKVLWEIYLSERNSKSKEFKKYRQENAYWLDDFVLFKILRDGHEGLPWYEWQEDYRHRDEPALKDIAKKYEKEIGFHAWLQWQLYEQFKEVRGYANKRGVLLKGDLPILVSRDSSDVWVHPEYFKLEYASGAPPDMYCAKGQRWGMPTYNWDGIETDDYQYLKEKLKYAQNFYDILRIDHVVGLFRIWSIPYDEPQENRGLNGFFDPKDENLWEAHGRKLLSIIVNNTDMLVCAEDLGIIPASCPKALAEFGIPGNDVQRWTKDWSNRHDFLNPEEFRFLSVAMLSTHDTTNAAAWWENEAGTVDEGLFIRKCNDRSIDYNQVKERLFDSSMSRHGRLRWKGSIDSVDLVVSILGKKREELKRFYRTIREFL